MFGQLTFFSYFSPLEKLLSLSDLKVQSVALQSKEQRKTRFPLVLCSLIRNFASEIKFRECPGGQKSDKSDK